MYWDRTEVGKIYSDFLALHSFASHVFCVCPVAYIIVTFCIDMEDPNDNLALRLPKDMP